MARSLAGKQGDCSLASGVLHARREVGVPLPNSLLSLSLCRLDEVQLIVEVPVSAEQYVAQGFQRSISPPDACPHCRAANALDILGYYSRSVTGKRSAVLRLSIRRFRCRTCRKTVSILPAFAQPYRLVHNHTVDRFFCGYRKSEDVAPWLPLLRRYWKRFAWWVSQTDAVLRGELDRAPPPGSPTAWWTTITVRFGNLVVATQFLVTRLQITLFGRYRCHHPNSP